VNLFGWWTVLQRRRGATELAEAGPKLDAMLCAAEPPKLDDAALRAYADYQHAEYERLYSEREQHDKDSWERSKELQVSAAAALTRACAARALLGELGEKA
jgi:hypothetical protein